MTEKQTLDYLAKCGVNLRHAIKQIGQRLEAWAKDTGMPGVPHENVRGIAEMCLEDLLQDLSEP